MRTTIQQLAEFLTACRGNWRNACFISCTVCKCHSPCSGYLMSADADGKPVLIPAAEYERLTSRSAFEDIYRLRPAGHWTTALTGSSRAGWSRRGAAVASMNRSMICFPACISRRYLQTRFCASAHS